MLYQVTQEELKRLIQTIDVRKKEFEDLKITYKYLQDTIEGIVESLPNAIWILKEDNEIFLQNSKAQDLKALFTLLELESNDYEITHNGDSYLIKISFYQDKKIVSATDITEQKHKKILVTMGQMATHISYEIRNPISSISHYSELLKKRVRDENISILKEIQKSTYRVEHIINTTLTFFKGVEIKKELLEWSTLRDFIALDISYYSYSKKITFSFPQEDFILRADKNLLEMLFSNMIINAIDAIELDEYESGSVEVVYICDESYHRFHIYDSGVAIQNKNDLFQAFKSSKLKGNGLGLVLCKQIAQAHGGDVVLLHEKQKGFKVTLLK